MRRASSSRFSGAADAEGAAEAGAGLLLEGEAFADICRALGDGAGVPPERAVNLVAVHRAVMTLDAVIPLVAQRYLDGELGSEGSYGWGSAYFPQYLVDPKERLVALFMTQHMPAGGLDLNQRFKPLVYQALVK